MCASWISRHLLGDQEVTVNLYCNFAYLYWEGCVICSIYITSVSPSSRDHFSLLILTRSKPGFSSMNLELHRAAPGYDEDCNLNFNISAVGVEGTLSKK